jgi:hypothetical protein
VFGFSAEGAAQAELAVLSYYAPIPPSLDFPGAAALPAAIETAMRTLDALGVGSGSTLLVNGASGSVGSAAVQLAVARGARVIGTASPANYPTSMRAGCVISRLPIGLVASSTRRRACRTRRGPCRQADQPKLGVPISPRGRTPAPPWSRYGPGGENRSTMSDLAATVISMEYEQVTEILAGMRLDPYCSLTPAVPRRGRC